MNCLKPIVFILLMVTGITLMNQCSPRAGKSLLQVFFDGVPEADSTRVSVTERAIPEGDTASKVPEVLAIRDQQGLVHYPYGEQECAACHDELSLGSMVEPQPGLCYVCHVDFAEIHEYLHGPVAGGYCTACHDPHRSANQHLLKLKGEALCFFCHKEAGVLKNEMHQDLEGMTCADCHNPHGGEDKN